MTYGFIYKIVDLINWKIYIGQSINPRRRWIQHQNGDTQCRISLIDQMIHQLGVSHFVITLLDCADTAYQLTKLEDYWIDFFGSLNPEYGYNKRKSNCVSQATRAKQSLSAKARRASLATRRKLRISHLGIAPTNKKKFSLSDTLSMIQLRQNGFSLEKIGTKFLVGKNVIRRILLDHNSFIPNQPISVKNFDIEQIKTIQQLRKDGKSLKNIGIQLKASPFVIKKVLMKNNQYTVVNTGRFQPGMPSTNKINLTKEQLTQVKDLKLNGYSVRYIASIINVSRDVILRIMKELNLISPKKNNNPSNKIEFTIEQIAQIQKLINDGYGSRHIAKIMKISRDVAVRIIKEIKSNHGKTGT